VAATYGPGLPGALLVGLNAAKSMAWARGLPFIGVNHLEGHIYANWLVPMGAAPQSTPAPQFPLVALIVSGGHTVLVLLRGHGQYQLLGQTRDDAAGEAFDKSARIMGLGYPGGPLIERVAQSGGLTLPRAWLRPSYDFSFSGLKTAVLRQIEEYRGREAKLLPKERAATKSAEGAAEALPERFVAQLAHAFQESVVDVLVTKTVDAAKEHAAAEILLAGGVAANQRLRDELMRRAPVPVRYPPLSLCTDNAAMIGAAAFFRYEAGYQAGWATDVQPNLRLV
jgi:N6-L-threonylcarbamoyladenine synthase